MTGLAHARPSTEHVAAQNHIAAALAGLASFFASLSRVLAFSRMCEAEFNRTGTIAPERFRRLIDQV